MKVITPIQKLAMAAWSLRDCNVFCVLPGLNVIRQVVFELNHQPIHCQFPIVDRHGPFLRCCLLRSQNKGQKACAAPFVDSIRAGTPAPIAYEEIMEVARVSIDVAEYLRGHV